jgi:hypothetical protein
MGWHYILNFTCKILPEYTDFITKKYLLMFYDSSLRYSDGDTGGMYDALGKDYKDLIDIWCKLDIAQICEYSFENNIFHCEISNSVYRYSGDLKNIYEEFMRDIIVPISSDITICSIESDDYILTKYNYTDTELRGKSFNLRDMIKSVEHTFNEDHTEIIETRVVYKRSIKALQFMDLDRAYKQ